MVVLVVKVVKVVIVGGGLGCGGGAKRRRPNIYPDRNQFTYRRTEPSGQVSPGDKH